VRKALTGYIYLVHYSVKELGNEKIGTIMLIEKENTLELIDVMQGHHLALKIVP
jgi:DNA integrity scanning protein DisA with diadenylate cyclase activity